MAIIARTRETTVLTHTRIRRTQRGIESSLSLSLSLFACDSGFWSRRAFYLWLRGAEIVFSRDRRARIIQHWDDDLARCPLSNGPPDPGLRSPLCAPLPDSAPANHPPASTVRPAEPVHVCVGSPRGETRTVPPTFRKRQRRVRRGMNRKSLQRLYCIPMERLAAPGTARSSRRHRRIHAI